MQFYQPLAFTALVGLVAASHLPFSEDGKPLLDLLCDLR